MPKQSLTPTLVHTNGFVRFYIPNIQGLGGEGLPPLDEYFIHVWARSTPSTDIFDTHNHIFTFQSEILHGGMTQEIYDPVVDENGDWMKIYCIPGGRIHRIGHNFYKLDVIETFHYKKGDIYELDEDDVHRVTDYEDGTVTKVVRYSEQKCRGLVFLHRKNWDQFLIKDDPLRYIATFGVSADV